ncbi:MAG: Holliday junction branch migration protein RuvA [bacterium]
MIYSITGLLELKEIGRVVVNAYGIGYELFIPLCVYEDLPAVNREVKMLTMESVSMYGGGTTLYGFLTEDQKNIYTAIKDFVPSTGAKKALDYLDKASKSLPDFKRAILENDPLPLVGILGFSKKAAEKIVTNLKDRIDKIHVSGNEKWSTTKLSGVTEEAVAALVALGYRRNEALEMVNSVERSQTVEQIIQNSLKKVSSK